jgi:uncharacterized protein YcbK (DUF882 family)
LDVKSPKLLRFRVNHLMILPIFAAIILSSCSSTVSNIDTAAASLQPQLTGPESSGTANPGAIPVPADKNAATLAMNSSEAAPRAKPSAPGAAQQPAQAITGSAALPGANDFTVASADTGQAEITAAALGAKPAAADATPATAGPAPIIMTAEAPAGTANLKAPGPTNQQVQLASAEAAVKPQGTELSNAAPKQQYLDPAPQNPAKKPRKTLFSAMFGDTEQKPSGIQAASAKLPAETQLALASPKPKSAALAAAAAEAETPQLSLSKAAIESDAPLAGPNLDNGDLPGVRKGALFEIKRRDSLNSDADVDIGETDNGPILLASAAGLGRLAPNGLKVQRESVDVACLKPQLVRMLKQLEAHYNRSAIVTSGYRSPGYNRRVRGAKNSLHMYCAAADIQIPGVGKWELAKYARSMPGRGGVGTYCHTDSVHVDVGPDRDWNWRCSRR